VSVASAICMHGPEKSKSDSSSSDVQVLRSSRAQVCARLMGLFSFASRMLNWPRSSKLRLGTICGSNQPEGRAAPALRAGSAACRLAYKHLQEKHSF
jgi:hypothetical protein